MKRNWLFPVLSAVLAIGIIAAGLWGYQQARARELLRNKIEGDYQRAFQELTSNVEEIGVKIGKALVSGTRTQTVANLTDVWRQASVAQANMGQLPLSRLALDRTEQFLAQTGDFAYVLARHQMDGQGFTKEEVATLKTIKKQAELLATALSKLQQESNKGGFRWEEVDELLSKQLKDADKNLAVSGFKNIEKAMVEYPTLVYDGPFSDHLVNRQPVGLTGENITREAALEIAKKFIGEERARRYNADYAGSTGGNIPSFSVVFTPKNGDESKQIYVDVSKKGGHVVWMLDQREPGKARLSVDECQNRAIAFLGEKGFVNMQITSTVEYENSVAFSYSYVQENIIIYPDLVKLEVARDNGTITGFDARDYLATHQKRDLPEPKITLEEARKKVADRLEISRERLTVIPLNSGKEALCYEFKGNAMGEEYLIYINAINGKEENILRVVKTAEGILSV